MSIVEITGLGAANMLSNLWFSVIVPFLPLEYDKLGIDPSLYGLIFAVYNFPVIFGSLLIGKMLTWYGRKMILIIGLCMMGIVMILYGTIEYNESTEIETDSSL